MMLRITTATVGMRETGDVCRIAQVQSKGKSDKFMR